LASHLASDFQHRFHHVEKAPAPITRAEGIVKYSVERVELLVNGVGLRVRLEDSRLEAGHRLLRQGVILVRTGHDRAGDFPSVGGVDDEGANGAGA